jgi:aldose 1-epimerase
MVQQQTFGSINNVTINKYEIESESLKCASINYGATITNLIVNDKNGKPTNIVLNFETIEQYIQNQQFYLGCICGRYANRIANGAFSINGIDYHLATNLPPNHLHGGVEGFNCKVWDAKVLPNAIEYTYHSKHMQEGYPGNLTVVITYSLINNKLIIDYKATTDLATPVNLTNHSYFNLSGNIDATISNHTMQIHANQLMEVNDTLIPTGKLVNVANTPYDFIQPKLLQQQYNNIDLYDNTWVLQGAKLQKAASVNYEPNGITLNCYTTKPSIHFYDGHFLSNPLQSKQGLCLEAQFLPDSPNQPNFPNTILQPNTIWQHQTIYEIVVEK